MQVTMNRKDLIEKLVLLQPALPPNDLLPVLTKYWFDGESIAAYNDRIGIRVPCKTPFKGGIPGQLLLKLLQTYGTDEVVLSVSDDGELVVVTRDEPADGARNGPLTSTIKLAMQPIDDIQDVLAKIPMPGKSAA